jgi:hypothetical protein
MTQTTQQPPNNDIITEIFSANNAEGNGSIQAVSEPAILEPITLTRSEVAETTTPLDQAPLTEDLQSAIKSVIPPAEQQDYLRRLGDLPAELLTKIREFINAITEGNPNPIKAVKALFAVGYAIPLAGCEPDNTQMVTTFLSWFINAHPILSLSLPFIVGIIGFIKGGEKPKFQGDPIGLGDKFALGTLSGIIMAAGMFADFWYDKGSVNIAAMTVIGVLIAGNKWSKRGITAGAGFLAGTGIEVISATTNLGGLGSVIIATGMAVIGSQIYTRYKPKQLKWSTDSDDYMPTNSSSQSSTETPPARQYPDLWQQPTSQTPGKKDNW